MVKWPLEGLHNYRLSLYSSRKLSTKPVFGRSVQERSKSRRNLETKTLLEEMPFAHPETLHTHPQKLNPKP